MNSNGSLLTTNAQCSTKSALVCLGR